MKQYHIVMLTLATVQAKPDEYKLEKYVSASTDDLSILCNKERRLIEQVTEYVENSGSSKDKTEFAKFK